ncbi:MAG TPA: hypothetical protein VK629_00160 [Steroidobacteraceae bacterium]|nr:hypothetical protein [Steroidobacteraceae bacterium]
MSNPFATEISEEGGKITGPLRVPRQMLSKQSYDNHVSIHDDAMAQKLGFKGGTIEGPTHFSQFVPLCVHLWGPSWFETGCLSAHYRNACYEGDRVRAFIEPNGTTQVTLGMVREDGTEILRGTASIGLNNPPSALEQRLRELTPLDKPVILRDVTVGMRSKRIAVRMEMTQNMGALYPFSLHDKLQVITEPSPWYTHEGAAGSPWQRPLIPIEMISVLCGYAKEADPLPIRGPVVGLFADQEIRLLKGPLWVGEPYEIDREVVFLSGSRRTESTWIRTRVYASGQDEVLATMLLNSASLRDSYANYAAEAQAIYGSA